MPRPRSGRWCSVDGCGRTHKGHGYCRNHLRSWQLCGDPVRLTLPARPPRRRPSSTLRAIPAELTERIGECLLWTGPRDQGGVGHGRLTVDGVRMPAHRAAWLLAYGGPVPPRVYRTCMHPLCVEPSHLTTARPYAPWVRFGALQVA